MVQHRVVLIGCGRMGSGIARMLLQEFLDEKIPYELWIYDPVKSVEDKCLAECGNISSKNLYSIRDLETKYDFNQLHLMMEQTRTQPSLTPKITVKLLNVLRPLEPHLILNAATYFAHRIYIPIAIQMNCDYIDLGQGIPITEELQEYEDMLRKHKSSSRIIQESGLAPGLANILAASLYEKAITDSPTQTIYSIQMRVGGLPQHTMKGGDLHYGPTFSPDGLIYEYEREAHSLRANKLVSSRTFNHPEYWEESTSDPLPIGIVPFEIQSRKIQSLLASRMEDQFFEWKNDIFYIKGLQARPTADGTSKMVFDRRFTATVSNLEYKTLRFTPHYQTWANLQRTSKLQELLNQWSSQLGDVEISGYPDMVLARVWVKVTRDSSPISIDLVTLHDDIPVGSSQGFTAMQHLTGWPTTLLALALLQRQPNNNRKSGSKIFHSNEYITSSGKTLEEFLTHGGIVVPYDILHGQRLLEKISNKHRIPLMELKLSEEW